MATVPKTLRLVPPQQPRLLAAPVEYNAQYQEQYSNTLRLYFNQSQNFLELFTSRTGGSFIQSPFGVFNATTSQIPTNINTAYGVTFNNTVSNNSVAIGFPTSRVITAIAGVYNFAFSLQLDLDSGANANTYIWARVNGVDVPNSARKVTVQSPATEIVVSGNFVLDMSTDEYFELMYSVDNTAVRISTFPVTDVPAIPAVILTVTFVSALLT